MAQRDTWGFRLEVAAYRSVSVKFGPDSMSHFPLMNFTSAVASDHLLDDTGKENGPARRCNDLAAPLPGEPWRATSSLASTPVPLAFPPVTLVGLFMPAASVVWLPLRRCITTPSCPGRRRHRVVLDRDSENRWRNVHRLDAPPRTVPGRPDVPSPSSEDPVLMGVEKDVRGSARRVVDRSARDDDECRGSRELNPDVDAHPHLCVSGSCDCCDQQRAKHESLHGSSIRALMLDLRQSRGRQTSCIRAP